MKLVDKIKAFPFKGTLDEILGKIMPMFKIYVAFSGDPKVALGLKVLDVYEELKEKKIKDISTEDAIKLAELYEKYNPKEMIIEKPVVAEIPVSVNIDPVVDTVPWDVVKEKMAVQNLQLGDSDPHSIIGCYGGSNMQTVSNLPIDFELNYNGGFTITVPKSATSMWGDAEPGGDHMLVRRGIVLMIKDDKVLAVSDFNSTQYDNRFSNLGANKILIVHCRFGKLVSRTKLTDIS